MESILASIKQKLGILDGYDHFDSDIIDHINSAFTDLQRLGVGPSDGFMIIDENDLWDDFFASEEKPKLLNNVKQYVYLQVKLVFDPPLNASVLASYERKIEKLEWCLNVAADHSDIPE